MSVVENVYKANEYPDVAKTSIVKKQYLWKEMLTSGDVFSRSFNIENEKHLPSSSIVAGG